MAGIRQGSYIVLSAVLEIMILVDKLFDKPFLKVLLAIMIFSTVFQVKPGQIHHGLFDQVQSEKLTGNQLLYQTVRFF